ncbi:MAG: hypothetical protein HRT37_01350 [Alteromonadaceae bacterium]|nr:hypothetical protein [Alteromonadaceae bacterium]
MGRKIAQVEFEDSDGITISMCLNIDTKGYLFELDVWKTDFSALLKFPTVSEIRIK